MRLSGWGRYPIVNACACRPDCEAGARRYLGTGLQIIARGFGRTYGDSALSENVMLTGRLNRLLDFDEKTGVLRCESGVSLAEIIECFLPRGWFPAVTPGTKFVSIGGAIASDVHGKNHHVAGCFSDCDLSFDLLLPSGEIVTCSREENRDLFSATCGGMGLTGIILRAAFKLAPLRSAYIDKTIIRTANLEETVQLFEECAGSTYSVAWIDCLARGERLGRSLLMLEEHSAEGRLKPSPQAALNLCFNLPGFVLNRYSVAAFNHLYYNRIRNRSVSHRVHYEPFFYPLDRIGNWNRLYGSSGFTQYQMVIPKAAGASALRKIVSEIAESGMGSFLAVLKLFGPQNGDCLSFPMEGYTLALDFRIQRRLFPLLERLDSIITHFGGRLYLTKDVRMSPKTLRAGYPRLDEFLAIRDRYGLSDRFHSLQSKRLGI